MNKKALVAGIIIASFALVMLGAVALSGDFQEYNDNGVGDISYTGTEEGDLPYELFETYGPLLLVLGLLMFGAIIGAAYVAKEDDDDGAN